MHALLTIVELTLHEALRRRILAASFLCGTAFVALFAVGLHFALRDIAEEGLAQTAQRALLLNFFTLAGLYAANFLTVMSAVLLPVDTLAGEIGSGVAQTLASKPVRRSTIVLGKWIAYALVVTAYLAFLAGGVLAVARVIGGFTLPHPEIGLPLMAMEALVLLTVSIAGSARLSTVTTGIVAFGLFGLAFIGNWVEQIGVMANNTAARNVGTVASLLMPSESLWMLAAHHMQPPIMSQLGMTPFSPLSVPSNATVVWAAVYVAAALAFALRSFSKRAL
jgi:ABC-type transport system involved in multi-copper enzyme maturation permease subunit